MIRAIASLVRLAHIVLTLARHDALFPLARLGPGPALIAAMPRRVFGRRGSKRRPGRRLAAALQDLGPSFVKLGQSLAVRSDLVGEDVAVDLSTLQDHLPPFPGSVARAIVEDELGEPVDKLYSEFADKPVAAASIAQVHLAAAADGTEVAVKVLRPGIEDQFARDLALFYWLAETAERWVPRLRRLRPVEVVRTFEATVAMEMDLRLEGAAASELAENFADDPDFRVPAVDWTRTARRVLTLARVEGIRIDRVDALEAAGFDPREILRKAAEAFFNQVFRDGFFHADLHPGNMFVARDGALSPVDFGIMGRIDRATRNFLADMLIGFLTRDFRQVAQVHFDAGYVPPHMSIDAFTQAVRSIGEPILGKPLHEISLARLLAQLFQITERFEMETQPQLLLLQKTMLVAEGVGRRLDPTVNMWTLAHPLIEAWVAENRGPQARVRDAVRESAAQLERLPRMLQRVEELVDRLHERCAASDPDRERDRRGAANWLAVVLLVLLAVMVVSG